MKRNASLANNNILHMYSMFMAGTGGAAGIVKFILIIFTLK